MTRSALLTLVTVTACTGPDTSDGDDTPADTDGFMLSWQVELEDDARGMFMSAWGTADDDVWIVGGRESQGVVLRGHAGAWTDVTLPPGTPMLTWVTGTAADDVWVVGLSGTILHWDGDAWTDHGVGTDEAFWGAYAHTADEVVAVGGKFRSNGEAPMAWRFDGMDWTALTLPAGMPDVSNLFKVHHDGTRFVVVGAGGASITVEGDTTQNIASGTTEDMVTVHRSPGGTVTAVGGRLTGFIWRWTGTGWAEDVQVLTGLSGVHEVEEGLLVCVGERGYAGTFDRAAGTWTEARTTTQDLLHATWVSPGGDAYGVGGNFYTSGEFEGVVMFSEGQ